MRITVVFLSIFMIMLLGGCTGENSVVKDKSGNYIAGGSGICLVEEQDITYTVNLRVTTDPDGRILSIKDAGTEIPDGKDGLYVTAQQLFDVLAGKDLNDLSDVDAISGATCSSKAIMEAVEDALNNIAQTKEK